MPRKRKTADERRAERDEAVWRAWNEFRPKLEAIQSYAEALNLVAHAPPVDTPGRPFYSNLGFFLQAFTPPLGATAREKSIYITLIKRMDATGELKAGEAPRIIAALEKAISEQWW
ncbi:MAG TPA: hypothetical protein VJU77_13440 [Chthoniobacterales bacterium]|nr:hypothetical protein [Chthoniobacterales bacterium]